MAEIDPTQLNQGAVVAPQVATLQPPQELDVAQASSYSPIVVTVGSQ